MECRHWSEQQVSNSLVKCYKSLWIAVWIAAFRKWKADKVGVQCICCYGDGSTLLTAGRAIKLWSLVDYTLIKVSPGLQAGPRTSVHDQLRLCPTYRESVDMRLLSTDWSSLGRTVFSLVLEMNVSLITGERE